MTFFDVVKNALLAGLGLQETVREFVDDLVKKGELSESQGAKLFKEWSERAEKSSDTLSRNLSDLITTSLKKMNIPTMDDMEKLNKEVDALSRRLAALESGARDAAKD